MKIFKPLLGLIALAAITIPVLSQDQQPMSFFITSVGSGDGGNLGGLAGADAHCQALASAAGRGDATWRAYLSQAPGRGAGRVHARDRARRIRFLQQRGFSFEACHKLLK